MDIKNKNTRLVKSIKFAGISGFIFAFYTMFIDHTIILVPSISLNFSIFYLFNSLKKNNVYVNNSFITFYSYLTPLFFIISIFLLHYYKFEATICIGLLMLILLPVILFNLEVINKTINFPNNVSLIGLSETNYHVVIDFNKKEFYAKNNFVTFDSDGIITGSNVNIYDLKKYSKDLKEYFDKDISTATNEEFQLVYALQY